MSPIFSKTIFNELRREGTLCDAVIRVDGVSFKIHRIVLCNSSMFFRELFCSLSPPSEHQVFSFSQVSPIIMSLILDFIYTGSVLVTEENVLELLAGAECFSVQGAVNACCHFLEQRLNIKNCVHIWMLAEFHKCPKLRQKAYLYVLHHFKEVAGFSVKFLQLSVQQLGDLIEQDELNVKQESTVFEAVQHWINYAPQERQGHMATLLSKVRLLFLPSNYLVETVINTDVVRKSVSCMTLVIDAMRTLRESNLERPLTRARLPSAVLMTIGGSERESLTDRMDFYDVRANCWLAMESREKALRVLHGCVFLNGFIYCIGGTDLLNILSSVQRFDLVSHNWQELVPIHKPRKCVSAVALNGCIYAIGGTDGSEQKLAERFQPEDNRWVMIAPMLECRSDACAVALDGKVGGAEDFNGAIESIWCFKLFSDVYKEGIYF
ncbi:LOW QUALITY PROTEIN: kelch-like protein 10 [Eleginops maclovinus]|uniref:LOW QUALITY PROTEIN: kelch-like protein 10 n=1 Tax=Eleginops maclovinus TaxID=56733 RepID=UPI003080D800